MSVGAAAAATGLCTSALVVTAVFVGKYKNEYYEKYPIAVISEEHLFTSLRTFRYILCKWEQSVIYFFVHVAGAKARNSGNISSLPSSIAADRISFENHEYSE